MQYLPSVYVCFMQLWLYSDTGERQDGRNAEAGTAVPQWAQLQAVSLLDDQVGGSLSLALEFRITQPGFHWWSAVVWPWAGCSTWLSISADSCGENHSLLHCLKKSYACHKAQSSYRLLWNLPQYFLASGKELITLSCELFDWLVLPVFYSRLSDIGLPIPWIRNAQIYLQILGDCTWHSIDFCCCSYCCFLLSIFC